MASFQLKKHKKIKNPLFIYLDLFDILVSPSVEQNGGEGDKKGVGEVSEEENLPKSQDIEYLKNRQS